MRDGIKYCRLGYGVEDHALDACLAERFLLLENLEHMPRDRLAFAIGIGSEDQLVGVANSLCDGIETRLRLAVDFPTHGKVVIRPDRAIL